MLAGRVAADAAERRRGSHAHAAVEGPERDHDARLEFRSHGLAVQFDDFLRSVSIAVSGNETAATVVGVVEGEIDGKNLHFQGIARLGASDIHRPGQDVPAGAATVAGHFGDDGF